MIFFKGIQINGPLLEVHYEVQDISMISSVLMFVICLSVHELMLKVHVFMCVRSGGRCDGMGFQYGWGCKEI